MRSRPSISIPPWCKSFSSRYLSESLLQGNPAKTEIKMWVFFWAGVYCGHAPPFFFPLRMSSRTWKKHQTDCADVFTTGSSRERCSVAEHLCAAMCIDKNVCERELKHSDFCTSICAMSGRAIGTRRWGETDVSFQWGCLKGATQQAPFPSAPYPQASPRTPPRQFIYSLFRHCV